MNETLNLILDTEQQTIKKENFIRRKMRKKKHLEQEWNKH